MDDQLINRMIGGVIGGISGMLAYGVIDGVKGMLVGVAARDASARKRCRRLCESLEDNFNRLVKQLKCSHRRSLDDVEKLATIKDIIKNLKIEKCDVLFRCNELEKCIKEGASLFERLELGGDEALNQPHIVAVDLLMGIWGSEELGSFKSVKFAEIQNFFQRSIIQRSIINYFICSALRLVKNLTRHLKNNPHLYF